MKTRYERQIIVDSETGEILNKYNKNEYKTIQIITTKKNYGNTTWISTTRVVEHNGQEKLIFD